MKRFEFSLNKLFDLRQFREKQAELQLGKALSHRDAVQALLDDVARKRVQASTSRGETVAVEDLIAIERYVFRLDQRKEELFEELAAAELVLERAREEFTLASRDRQVLEKLKDKKQAEWRKDYLSEEASMLDDLTSSKRADRD
ncbi:flagellar export protein FliJ [Treponema zuelzerae]|uniref:Flagellar FliJ protein n=1 Tax=Teretinema zuelzerae TaxID=156 RepID=A0AAE3EFC3_9SPIR|nr:flagellar export protein FliJ [Teretinema zuelzerae]MCD1653236.1 flagellar export protein FliJ [Teretinema zuelzerae]